MRFLVVTNTLAQVLGKVITAGTTFLITILIARAFGVEGYGEFTKITTYVAIFYLFADFGINAIYLQKNSNWQTLFGLRLALSLFLTFLAIAILSFLPQGTYQGYTPPVRLGIILYSATIIFQAILTTANAFFQKNLSYQKSTLAIAAGSLLSLFLVYFIRQWLINIFALVLGSAASALVALYFVKRSGQSLLPAFGGAGTLFFAAVPLGLTLIFNVVYFHIDSLILTLTRSTSEVGLYGLAYKVFETTLVLPTFFMNAIYPFMLRAKGLSMVNLIKKSALVLLITSLLSLIAFWVAAPLLVFIKQDFSASISALRILSLGLPFFFLTSLIMWTLIALGKQMLLVIIYGASMVLTILLDILFIPSYGYIAAAWITVISEILVLLISSFFLFRYFQNRKNNLGSSI